MRILIAHNRYRSRLGGEDVVVTSEKELLRTCGHEVVECAVDNNDIGRQGRLRVAANAVWNPQAYDMVSRLVSQHRIEVAHFHNTQPLLSPAVYYAARKAGARV